MSAPVAVEAPPPRPRPSPSAEPPARAEIRYLALGDSFTIGTGSRPDQAFPARLAEGLRARGRAVTLQNVAVNGFTTQDVLDREIAAVAPFAPTLITLAIGANDLVHGSSAVTYRAQVGRIFAAITSASVPITSVVALPQPDWSLAPIAAGFGDRRLLAGRIEVFNTVLREEAESRGARYIDIFPLMHSQAKQGMFASDGLHPTAAAHLAWAAELAARLEP
jgi:lysophospholipase L1-like esterase